jgi:hypothetical protein
MARRPARGGGRAGRGLSKWQRAALDRADDDGTPRGVGGGWGETVEQHRDGEWVVRRLAGGDKAYVCPRCSLQVAPGTPHVVAWRTERPLLDPDAASTRRHWHTACWQQRSRTGR